MTREMVLLVADYSALEVVILADLCLRLFGDDQLAKLVVPGAPDIHSLNARLVYGEYLKRTVPEFVVVEGKKIACPYAGQRVDAIPIASFKKDPFGAVLRGEIKTVFYGWCYGKRGYGFSTLEGPDGQPIGEKKADELVAGLTFALPGLGRLEKWVEAFVDENHGIYSLGGRWCDLSLEMESEDDWMHKRAYRRAQNFPCQSSGADIIGDAMVRVVKCVDLREMDYKLLLNVHDELVLRGPLEYVDDATKALSKHMCSATANGTKLLIPLQVSVNHGPNYWEAK